MHALTLLRYTASVYGANHAHRLQEKQLVLTSARGGRFVISSDGSTHNSITKVRGASPLASHLMYLLA
jgi:hypothetical protein